MFCRKTRKVIALLVTTLLISVPTVVLATESSAELPTVKIVYWRSIDDLPLYVGVEKGFFKEAGVNVELEYIKGEPNVLAAVLRGDVSAGVISLASLIKLAEKKSTDKSSNVDGPCPRKDQMRHSCWCSDKI